MANKQLFRSMLGKLIPKTDTLNHELAPAYKRTPRQALAQYAATGCLNHTFYASADEQLAEVLALSSKLESEYIARVALYARQRGHMKDMPALLCAVLSVQDARLLERVFDRVIDNGKMLRNFVQIMRSGVVGRKSLGSLPKRLVREWLAARSDDALFRDSVGRSPSLKDIIRMVHPKPASAGREALYGYLVDREYNEADLPELVRDWEAYKRQDTRDVPDVPFQLLSSLELGRREWVRIAECAGWQMTRMNLNTFARHGVFDHFGPTRLVARRLRDPKAIGKARVFPYQLLMAWKMASESVPRVVRDALQDAMELAIGNVPALDCQVYVCPDVSGSMAWSSVTGFRKGATSSVRCIDVAALVAAAVLRRNGWAEVLPFEHEVVRLDINPRDSVMTNAARLASVGGGGTNISAPLRLLNKRKARGELVMLVSDNESWVDAQGGRGTALMREWSIFKRRNPSARLVCLDIQASGTTQAIEREGILNIGGFSDAVFEAVAAFAAGELDADHHVGVIESMEL